MSETPLPGGFINPVVRVDDSVRRTRASDFVHRLLRHFEAHGYSGAPRLIGIDDQGREMLGYVDGVVPWEEPFGDAVRTPEAIATAARLMRRFHDLTAGTALAGDEEVVCHNDLSPKNTVYRGDPPLPVVFLDWDIAAPGRRIHDLAHLCWQYIGLGTTPSDDWDALLRLACDSYGECDRDRLIETVLWWQDRCWRGIESAAADGDPAMIRLRERGVPADIRRAWAAVRDRQSALEQALRN